VSLVFQLLLLAPVQVRLALAPTTSSRILFAWLKSSE
jgi:hypothetical protein